MAVVQILRFDLEVPAERRLRFWLELGLPCLLPGVALAALRERDEHGVRLVLRVHAVGHDPLQTELVPLRLLGFDLVPRAVEYTLAGPQRLLVELQYPAALALRAS